MDPGIKLANKAVVIGVNYYIGLSVLRCLGRRGVPTVACEYDADAYGLRSKYVDEVWEMPDMKVSRRAFIDKLIEYGMLQKEKPVLFPCHDNYVECIDEYLEELKKYFLIPIEIQGLPTRVINKDTLRELALEHDVLVPPTIYEDEENLFEKVAHEVGYPCLVKPIDSPAFMKVFRKKVFVVEDESQLKEGMRKAEDAEIPVMIQRIIKGFDDHMFTYDAYLNHEGRVTHWMTAQKLRQWPINYGASVFIRQRHVLEIAEVGKNFLEDIGWRGFAEIEFKKDAETGEFYLIEINARTTNFNGMIERAGLNMPYICYRELTGSPLEDEAITEDTGLAFCYFFEDFMARRQYRRTGQLTRRKMLSDFFKYRKVYAIWEWGDTKPFFHYARQMIRKIAKKLRR